MIDQRNTKKTLKRINASLFYVLCIAVCLGLLFLTNNQLTNNSVEANSPTSNTINKTQEPQVLADTSSLPQAAQQQIAAIIAEKNSRSPQQKKMESRLIRAVKENRGQPFVDGINTLRPVSLDVDKEGNVLIDLKVTTTNDTFQQKLAEYGAKIIYDDPDALSIRLRVPMNSIEGMASLSEVLYIQPAMQAQLERRDMSAATSNSSNIVSSLVGPVVNQSNSASRQANVRENLPLLLSSLDKNKKPKINPQTGSVNSQGDTTHRAALARTTFNTTGAGIKIGVLSDTFNALGGANNDVLTGNLPGPGNPNGNTTPVTVLQDLPTGTDEGRAMLQIVHDIAPGAQLFYATAFGGVASFAANIQALRNAGCDIIIDDVFYFNESPFQDGPIAQAVNTVTAGGALYFSSAGNAGSLLKGTSGVWEGDFVSAGVLANLPGGTVNNFTPGGSSPTTANPVPVTAGSFYTMFWSDPLGASNNDYDFFIFDSTLTILFDMGTGVQNGAQDPFEISAGGPFTGDRVVIFKSDAAAPRALHLNTNRGRLTVATQGQSKGHNSAVNAFSCAATPTGPASAGVTGPFPNPFSATSLLENFSSDGPRRVFYNVNGTAITPGNLLFATNGGTVRNKPDITAADGVSTTLVGGLNPFFGTSAAAPHAGAIAALVKSANPNLTTTQIRSILTLSAIDIEGPGRDNNSGFGILDAFSAVQAIQGQSTITFGGFVATEGVPRNNNGFIEPGERGNLAITLNNPTTTTATNVSATLALTTPVAGVTISNPTVNYGNIAATSSGTNTFRIQLSSSVLCGANLPFRLTVSFGGGTSPLSFTFNLQTGKPATISTTITTVLDATAPPAGTGYVATTGTQTGRLLRNGIASSCAVQKVNPGLNDATVVRRFDSYVFTNTTPTTLCYTARLTQPTTTLFFLSYNNNGFVPATPSVNYLADPGASAATSTFSFNVPAGQRFTVTVHEVNANGGLNTTYTLNVSAPGFTCEAVPAFAQEHASIFVADTANNRIQRTDDEGNTWTSVGFGAGTAPGRFNAPRGVTSSSDNLKVFVSDTGNNRIQRSTDGGVSWTVIVGPGTAPNAVSQPNGLYYDEPNDRLYIADTANSRILVTSTASTTPVTSVFAGATAGNTIGKFIQPRGVTVDLAGVVYVADTGNSRVQVNSDGQTTGWSVFAGATGGVGIGFVNAPRGIFVDSNNKVYIADTGNNRIQVNSTGAVGGWSVFMSPGATVGSVNGVEGMTVSAAGNVFIGDTLNNRVQRKPALGGTAVVVGTAGLGTGQFNSPTGVR